MDEQQHEEDHRWISERRNDQRRWSDRKEATIKALFVWAIVGIFTGIGAVFAYAAKIFFGGAK